jgi:hypothetical protein
VIDRREKALHRSGYSRMGCSSLRETRKFIDRQVIDSRAYSVSRSVARKPSRLNDALKAIG